jgi:hypothetical protein
VWKFLPGRILYLIKLLKFQPVPGRDPNLLLYHKFLFLSSFILKLPNF